MAIDVDRLVGLIEDAAIRYAGGCPVDFRPTAKEIAGIVLEEAAKAFSDHDKAGREWVRGSLWDTLTNEGVARIRALAKGVE